MSFHITKHDYHRIMNSARVAHNELAGHKNRIEGWTGQAVQSATINGAALLTGLAQGRFGPMYLPGDVPAAAVVGLAAHVAGFFGLGGKYNQTLHNAADGVLASYAHLVGMGLGGKVRTAQGLPAIWGEAAGALGAGAGPVTAREMSSLRHAVR